MIPAAPEEGTFQVVDLPLPLTPSDFTFVLPYERLNITQGVYERLLNARLRRACVTPEADTPTVVGGG